MMKNVREKQKQKSVENCLPCNCNEVRLLAAYRLLEFAPQEHFRVVFDAFAWANSDDHHRRCHFQMNFDAHELCS